jgi:micrococcal nuclease
LKAFTHFLAAVLCWTITGATPIRTIDGDTFIATLPIWINTTTQETIRVLGIDTPEMKGATRPDAEKAKAHTQSWLDRGAFSIEACKRDSFGRVLGKVYRGDSVLADELIKERLGRKFP